MGAFNVKVTFEVTQDDNPNFVTRIVYETKEPTYKGLVEFEQAVLPPVMKTLMDMAAPG